MRTATVSAIHARTGRVIGSYKTRSGELVWMIDWDDRDQNPPVDLVYADDLAVGQRVQLAGGRLERLR